MSELYDIFRLTPEQLRMAGALLYGETWQTELARALNVDPRRVRQWLSGDRPIPTGLWIEIIDLLRTNSEEIAIYANGLQEQYEQIKTRIPDK